jgi:tetratricopeptide (TPR) repeat protein
MTSPARRLLLACLCVISVADVLAQQRWYEAYDEAIAHVKQQQWPEAEAKLLQARKLRPESGRNVLRYGMLRTDYFPDYYLGVVYLAMGRPKEALQMFAQAREANINTRSQEFREIDALTQRATELDERLARARNPPPPPPSEKPAKPVDEAKKEKPPVEPPPPPPPDFRAEFEKLLSAANAQLQQGNLQAAEGNANAALEVATRRNLPAERSRAEGVLGQISGMRTATRIEDAIKRRDAATARREVDALVARSPNYDTTPLRRQVDQLERELQAGQLQRDAMRAFYAGEYQQSLSLLRQMDKLGAMTPRAHFYRACSLAAMVSTMTTPSDDRMAEARQSLRLAARAPNEYRSDLAYISPRVLQLLGVARTKD